MTLEFAWWDHFEHRAGVPFVQQYEERIALVAHAEKLGFHGYYVAEHHFATLDMVASPLLMHAALAQRTSKIMLGTAVLCLPLYHPTRLVQDICVVDQMSKGRLVLGVGHGVRDCEHEWLSVPPKEARERMLETLAIVRQGLKQGLLNYEGKYYQYKDVPTNFAPYQKPTPRFLYAGNGKFAATNGMHCISGYSRDAVENYWRIWEEEKAKGNPLLEGPPARMGSPHRMVIGETDEKAMAIAHRAFKAYKRNFFSTSTLSEGVNLTPAMMGMDVDDASKHLASGQIIAGSPATIRSKLEAFLDRVGPKYNYLIGVFQWGDMTSEEARLSLDLFASEIMPKLKR